MHPALLLLHGNNLDEALYLGLAGLLYIVVMASYSHWKTARIKREKARRKAERAAERARRQATTELTQPAPASNSSAEPVNSDNELT